MTTKESKADKDKRTLGFRVRDGERGWMRSSIGGGPIECGKWGTPMARFAAGDLLAASRSKTARLVRVMRPATSSTATIARLTAELEELRATTTSVDAYSALLLNRDRGDAALAKAIEERDAAERGWTSASETLLQVNAANNAMREAVTRAERERDGWKRDCGKANAAKRPIREALIAVVNALPNQRMGADVSDELLVHQWERFPRDIAEILSDVEESREERDSALAARDEWKAKCEAAEKRASAGVEGWADFRREHHELKARALRAEAALGWHSAETVAAALAIADRHIDGTTRANHGALVGAYFDALAAERAAQQAAPPSSISKGADWSGAGTKPVEMAPPTPSMAPRSVSFCGVPWNTIAKPEPIVGASGKNPLDETREEAARTIERNTFHASPPAQTPPPSPLATPVAGEPSNQGTVAASAGRVSGPTDEDLGRIIHDRRFPHVAWPTLAPSEQEDWRRSGAAVRAAFDALYTAKVST